MLKVDIPNRIDGVSIGEVEIKTAMLGGAQAFTMAAKYALVVTSQGTNVGAGNRSVWTEKTHEKMRELIRSMEEDIVEDVFGKRPTSDGSAPVDDTHSDGVPEL